MQSGTFQPSSPRQRNAMPDIDDALIDALGKVIADARKDWSREREVISAETRAVIAELGPRFWISSRRSKSRSSGAIDQG
jgi:hypothetical protein